MRKVRVLECKQDLSVGGFDKARICSIYLPYSTRIRVVISIFRTSILFNFMFWHIAFRSVHLDRFGPFDVFFVVFVTYRYYGDR